ncbi:DNA helicase MCM8-like isoform X2 [Battus philenor]|uniref:DNA helicase MCM8-like isoform X2 n=1 Tax=Battus philenor TaxID=42288 RepID=UPI0035D07622
MRRNWRGRYRNNWYRSRGKSDCNNRSTENTSTYRSSNSQQLSHSASSSRAPANQIPLVIPVSLKHQNNTWKLYFPTEEQLSNSETSKHVETFKTFILKHKSLFDLEKIDQNRSVHLDIQMMLENTDFTTGWPSFQNDLCDMPETTLRLLEFCLHEVLKCESKIRVRILNHQPVTPIANLKVNYFAPNFCQSCQSGHKFGTLQSSPYTNTIDCQVVKIQEIQSQSVSGTIPRSVEIDLQGDLVGTACPGDVLSVTGIVQVRGESKGGEDGKRAARLLQLYIDAVSIHSQRNLSNPTLSFTLKDYYAIQEIHASEDVFRLLVHSLCPTIFGHEVVKAGLILGLLGGTEDEGGTRPHPHVLIVGDPGLGKSQLLQAAAYAAPRGVYVCGASASGGGLTVALGREAGGDFALEAGALVLADQGVCCLDELDKMTAHHSSLLEAMEQRRVSLAKGGVVCSLAARATVLAAANPSGGSYNRAKTVAENLKLNSALLSRFDLVFILLDQPDEKIDAMLSEHVLALHGGSKPGSTMTSFNVDINTSQNNEDVSLSKRLRLKPGEVVDALPLVLLRKYIAYARRYVHPKLSMEAANTLQNFYLELRHNYQGTCNDGTPITTRQLEASIRLTQARARAELREEATANDANDVISLIKHSLVDTFSDEFGNIQLSRSINGSGISSRSKLKKFLDALTRRSQQLGKDLFTKQEMIQIHKAAGIAGDPNDLIEALHTHAYLLLKGSNLYQLIAI